MSLNRISNRKQLDVHLIYCDDAESLHMSTLHVHNMIQISMDAPNVNWKMVEIANEHHKEQDPDALSLLETGSCGLHVLHGAYKTVCYVMEVK